MKRNAASAAILGVAVAVLVGFAPAGPSVAQGALVAPGLVVPPMNPQEGKKLFASKGCVVCHQVHGIGGTDAPSLDVSTMNPVMSPFDFFAKMWKGSEAMIAMQKSEIGGQIQFNGQELADIVAFLHNRAVQQTFTENDIPDNIKKYMEGDEDSGGMGGMMKDDSMGGGMMKGK